MSDMTLLDATPKEFANVQTINSRYEEADPIYLGMAIALVYDRREREEASTKRSKGSEEAVLSSRKYRPELVAEIESRWRELAGVDDADDLFPYHESYVVRKWVDFRKSAVLHRAWIHEAKKHIGEI